MRRSAWLLEARPPGRRPISTPRKRLRASRWNDYFAPHIVIQKPSLFTVQLAIGNFSNFYTTDESLLFAGLALATIPPLVVFAVLQRWFIQGLTVGALRD